LVAKVSYTNFIIHIINSLIIVIYELLQYIYCIWEKKNSINARLSKYVEFWKQGIDQKSTYAMKMASYIEYHDDILLHLSKSFSKFNTIGGILAFKQLKV
jgi:hypothetical protein